MGDQIQQQLDRLLHLFLEEQAANKARSDELHARIEALSLKESESHGSLGGGGLGGQGSQGGGGAGGQGSQGSHGGGGTLPRFSKLDFPKFSGTEDPLGWLNRCEHFFRHQQTTEAEKVGLASYHLEGNAQLWFIQLLADYPNPTWETFKTQCNLRFGPPIRSNKLGELAKLKQTGSVVDYQTQFEALVSRAGTLTQLQRVQLYISGLKEYIAVEVELYNPADLATAMSMSRLYERKAVPFRPSTPVVARPVQPSPGRQIKRLTREEMDERRRKGLCFNCDEFFTRGHQCKRLFWVELEEREDEEVLGDESTQELLPEISLNAITGAHQAQTMRVKGEWHGRSVLILID